jgi:hypothetical protein
MKRLAQKLNVDMEEIAKELHKRATIVALVRPQTRRARSVVDGSAKADDPVK